MVAFFDIRHARPLSTFQIYDNLIHSDSLQIYEMHAQKSFLFRRIGFYDIFVNGIYFPCRIFVLFSRIINVLGQCSYECVFRFVHFNRDSSMCLLISYTISMAQLVLVAGFRPSYPLPTHFQMSDRLTAILDNGKYPKIINIKTSIQQKYREVEKKIYAKTDHSAKILQWILFHSQTQQTTNFFFDFLSEMYLNSCSFFLISVLTLSLSIIQ